MDWSPEALAVLLTLPREWEPAAYRQLYSHKCGVTWKTWDRGPRVPGYGILG